MKVFPTALTCATMALIVSGFVTTVHAADDMKNTESAVKDSAKKAEVMDCEKHMAKSEKHVGKKDDTMTMHDKQCADLMRKEGLLEKSMIRK